MDLIACKRHLIQTIFEKVNEYNSVFGDTRYDWYRNFWTSMQNRLDVFNLNYDTTIETSLGNYEDGFESLKDENKFKRFNIIKLLENKRNLSNKQLKFYE